MSFWDILRSPTAIAGFTAWTLAQMLKLPIDYLRNRTWNWAILASAGGMPSSHSALMSAVTTCVGFYSGWDSPLFALAFAISAIVIYDATGVRRQSGLQAERINLIVREILENRKWPEAEFKSLREVIGHSPGEAMAGVAFGLAIAFLVRLVMPPV